MTPPPAPSRHTDESTIPNEEMQSLPPRSPHPELTEQQKELLKDLPPLVLSSKNTSESSIPALTTSPTSITDKGTLSFPQSNVEPVIQVQSNGLPIVPPPVVRLGAQEQQNNLSPESQHEAETQHTTNSNIADLLIEAGAMIDDGTVIHKRENSFMEMKISPTPDDSVVDNNYVFVPNEENIAQPLQSHDYINEVYSQTPSPMITENTNENLGNVTDEDSIILANSVNGINPAYQIEDEIDPNWKPWTPEDTDVEVDTKPKLKTRGIKI